MFTLYISPHIFIMCLYPQLALAMLMFSQKLLCPRVQTAGVWSLAL